ncbi:DUF6159 family protein [Nocardia sp. NPDC058497]|uniref:DUF6159 family protein n=1 Tax=Nocardia sp. NPDC058497 TaxID=3346529 RepID=UPI00364A1201
MAVLKSAKRLAVFPILSGLANMVTIATFVMPIVRFGMWERSSVTTCVLIGLLYLTMAFVASFFNAALISQADVALRGGTPSVTGGVRVAAARWRRVLLWSLVSATVAHVLHLVQERFGFLGWIVTAITGTAWQVATFLAVPQMVLADRGFVDAVKDSAESMKRTWGANLVGTVGFHLFLMAAITPGIVLSILSLPVLGVSTALAKLGIAGGILWVIAVLIMLSAVSGIFQTAIYRFSTDGTAPNAFDPDDLAYAFQRR